MQEQREERNKKNQDCMSLEGFCRYMKTAIQQRLGSDCLVSMHQVTKNNGLMLQGLSIQERGSNLSPNIYLDFYYNQYRHGRSLKEMELDILEVYQQKKISVEVDMSFFKEWEQVKKSIVFKLVNYEQNRELLREIPYVPFLDLAVVPYVLLELQEKDYGAIQIHKKHLELWNVTEHQVFEAAKENTPKLLPHNLKHMTDIIAEVITQGEENSISKVYLDLEVGDALQFTMYALSNQYLLHGAVCILYPNVLAEFANKMNSDLYILPSSIHEVLLILTDEKTSSDLSKTVRDINETEVLRQDILSNHVYKFTRETGKITMEETEE